MRPLLPLAALLFLTTSPPRTAVAQAPSPESAGPAAAAARGGTGTAAVVRYVRFERAGRAAYGILEGETVVELAGDILSSPRRTGRTFPLADVRLLAPLDPEAVSKVIGTAVNTRRPGLEVAPGSHPRWFAKFPTSLNDPGGEVELPPEASNLNYEGELVLVIGKAGRHIPRERALDHIFGVSVGNDYSENTWYGERQGRDEPTRLISKGMDTWAVMGPSIVTGIDFTDLAVETRLNGEVVQRGRTSDLIQDVPELVSNLSRYITLLPGDVIYTGTVPFVEGARRVMRPGDVVEVEIDQLGTLSSRIVAMDDAPSTGVAHRFEGALPPSGRRPAPARGVELTPPSPDATPVYEVDPFWPRPLPNNWAIGQVSGVAVDAEDHVWVLHRPGTLTDREAGAVQDPPLSECCVPAPPVIELDGDGNVLRAWGGPGEGYDWPTSEHTLHVDPEGDIWIGSNGRNDAHVLKFSPDGRFLLQIGQPGMNQGSNDTLNLGQPAGLHVDGGELYVADGYGNRRVIVFDAKTGAYRRHWGAYGERPSDVDPGPYDPDAPPARTFRSPVHGVRVSNDGQVYVADRVNNRIQVFTRDGRFVREAFLAPRTLGMGSVWDIAFSRDPEQRFLLVPDGTNQKVWVLDRTTLEPVSSFGRGGKWAGQFGWVHNLAIDSFGNAYATEVENGKRVQKFILTGWSR